MIWRTIFFAAVAFVYDAAAYAQDLDFRGEIRLDETLFTKKASPKKQFTLAVTTEFTIDATFNDAFSARLSGYGRYDDTRGAKTISEFPEAWLRYGSDSVEVKAGVDIISWPSLEFFQFMDFMNQRDLTRPERVPRKVGRNMAKVAFFTEKFLLEGYILPGFKKPLYAKKGSRFAFQLPVSTDARFESSGGKSKVGYAARAEYLGENLTLGVLAYHGYQTFPALLPKFTGTEISLRQEYNVGTHLGLYNRYLWSGFDTIFKVDLMRSLDFLDARGDERDYTTYGIGVEKEISEFLFNNTSATLFLEYKKDTRDRLTTDAYSKAVGFGINLDFHDPNSSKLSVSLVQDTNGDNKSLIAMFDRRLSDNIVFDIKAQFFHDLTEEGKLSHLKNASNLQMGITARF